MLKQWKTLVAALAFVLAAAPALADAIDGDWCHTKDGRRFTIRGPEIVTPGGKKMQGDYAATLSPMRCRSRGRAKPCS